ncbi:4'-phosphopantetheinyl transferase family protein [Paenibacillus caseinilyticus]|uniref:4'-phosphopantetheinyl transferase family protein n=1 Tax=Paenibacillus caseinilyticus TaxID=3098138 RepID=UPI0022B87938|nr:4'-phosphopantetheinyl transferase family protein [Paenibacillus caseinilyticus]MCZ8522705.1 4'-phosphopantetheinyl transferase superfamily protein [Paenibacillus caseinilyticus]
MLFTPQRRYKAVLAACATADVPDEQAGWLHAGELAYLDKQTFERRRRSYLAGRYAAKHAAAAWLKGGIPLRDIAVLHGLLEHPVVTVPGHSNVQTSITHVDRAACALAFHEDIPLGIDLELIREDRTDAMDSLLTAAERDALRQLPYARSTALALLWTAKEALSKVLRTGLTMPVSCYETLHLQAEEMMMQGQYVCFPQYRFTAFVAGPSAVAIAYPRDAVLEASEGGTASFISGISNTFSIPGDPL